jgi:hypothetical protein
MEGDIITSKVLSIGQCVPYGTSLHAHWARGPNDESQNEQLDIGCVLIPVYLPSANVIQPSYVDTAIGRGVVFGANWRSSTGVYS